VTVDPHVEVVEASQGILSCQIVGKHVDSFRGECGRDVRVCLVQPDARPPFGTAWFRADAEGIMRFWKEHYDSSD